MKKDTIKQIIRLWFDRLVGRNDERAVKQWLAGTDDESDKRDAFFDIWQQADGFDAADGFADAATTRDALARFEATRDAYEHKLAARARRRAFMRIAASIAIPVVTAVAVWLGSTYYYDVDTKLVEMTVPANGLDSLMLPDGTLVYVNGSSTLYYPKQFGRGDRDVYLLGEANFKVAKDKRHPFIVHANKLSVQAVGTKFNVHAPQDSNTITATLEEGLVKVYDGKFTSMLRPGDQIEYDKLTGAARKHSARIAPVVSWTKGDMAFDKATLREIIGTISQRFDVAIKMPAKVNMNRRFTMEFRHDESLEEILKVVTSVQKYHYKIDGRNVTIYRSPS